MANIEEDMAKKIRKEINYGTKPKKKRETKREREGQRERERERERESPNVDEPIAQGNISLSLFVRLSV